MRVRFPSLTGKQPATLPVTHLPQLADQYISVTLNSGRLQCELRVIGRTGRSGPHGLNGNVLATRQEYRPKRGLLELSSTRNISCCQQCSALIKGHVVNVPRA